MTIDKAIELLEEATIELSPIAPEALYDAIKLGIEALKRTTDGRSKGYDYFGHLLPGETEE